MNRDRIIEQILIKLMHGIGLAGVIALFQFFGYISLPIWLYFFIIITPSFIIQIVAMFVVISSVCLMGRKNYADYLEARCIQEGIKDNTIEELIEWLRK